jgi:hypothetical protein
MRAVPSQTVSVLPEAGNPELTDYVFNAPAGANVTVEFCDDSWRPVAAAATHSLGAGSNTTLVALVGTVPAGATRARCYTNAPIYWNLSARSVRTPSVSQIPAAAEFDLGVLE